VPTPHEILLAVVLPAIISTLLAALGAWRTWTWAMPLAAGIAFIVSYASFNVPKLKPTDGSDWLFWLAIPLTLLATLDGIFGKRWGLILAGFAGVMVAVLIHPLINPKVPDSPTPRTLWTMAIITALTTIALAAIADVAQRRLGSLWIILAFCIATGGVGVVILSSNLHTTGLYGIAASSALGPIALFAIRLNAARSMAIFAAPLLASLLIIGRFYPDPGVSWTNFTVLLASPALLLIGAFLPLKRQWLRGLIALLAVTIAVAAVTAPTAQAAKKAAGEDTINDPYK
jgi:hypothetical protein